MDCVLSVMNCNIFSGYYKNNQHRKTEYCYQQRLTQNPVITQYPFLQQVIHYAKHKQQIQGINKRNEKSGYKFNFHF
jgi:hypothetical protein